VVRVDDSAAEIPVTKGIPLDPKSNDPVAPPGTVTVCINVPTPGTPSQIWKNTSPAVALCPMADSNLPGADFAVLLASSADEKDRCSLKYILSIELNRPKIQLGSSD